MSSIFISYSQTDAKIADEITAVLDGLQIVYFRDVKNIVWGAPINARVREALQRCVAILVIVSPSSLQSQWVPYEIGYASALGKMVLPFLTHPSLAIPLYMRDLHFITTHDQIREHFLCFPLESEVSLTAHPNRQVYGAYWLSHDLMWVAHVLEGGYSLEDVLYGLKLCLIHATEIGGQHTHAFSRLKAQVDFLEEKRTHALQEFSESDRRQIFLAAIEAISAFAESIAIPEHTPMQDENLRASWQKFKMSGEGIYRTREFKLIHHQTK